MRPAPNRLQHCYPFQLILKPSPLNIQELYLESLVRLGIDLHLHDEPRRLGAGPGSLVRRHGSALFEYCVKIGG